MSEFRKVLRGEASDALVFTGSNLINRVGGLLLLPLYWTKLTPTDYGVLALEPSKATPARLGAYLKTSPDDSPVAPLALEIPVDAALPER